MPPTDPNIPPIPTTEDTARLGNISDAVVKILALQAWWAAAARLISATTVQMLEKYRTDMIGTTQQANSNMADRRARFTAHPLGIRQEDRNPPPILPIVEEE